MAQKKIHIPAELLEELKEIPGAENIKEERVAVMLRAALETLKKEAAQGELQKILDKQDADFSMNLLDYAKALADADAVRRGYIQSTALAVAAFDTINKTRCAWTFATHLSGKGATA